MKFSIIVPAHNSEEYLSKCLSSITSQSYKDYELIVICDSCTDNTEQIAKRYTDKVYTVTYKKPGLTRNVGLDKANGEYVLFMDSDDWYLHEFVLEQIAEKLSDEDVLIFSLIWRHMGYTGTRSVKGTIFPFVSNKCWRRKFIGRTRFTDVYVAADEEFFKILLTKNPKIVEWDMPLLYYNWLRKGSISDSLKRSADKSKLYWSTH